MACDTRYSDASSADAEAHRRADLRELSQIEPEPAQLGWVDTG